MGFLGQARAGAFTVIDSVAGATQVHRARPASIASLPCVWVDDAAFSLDHSAGIRSWNGTLEVWVAYDAFDNEDGLVRAETLLDTILDAFSADPHWPGTNTIGEPRGVRTDSFDGGDGVTYPALVVTLGNIQMKDGRV